MCERLSEPMQNKEASLFIIEHDKKDDNDDTECREDAVRSKMCSTNTCTQTGL